MKKGLSRLVYVIVFSASITYLITKRESLSILFDISPLYLAYMIFLSIAAIYFNGLMLKRLCHIFSKPLVFQEWFGLTASNMMYNYLSPAKGGAIAKGLYLKTRHGLPVSQYVILSMGAAWFGIEAAAIITTFFAIPSLTHQGHIGEYAFGLGLAVLFINSFLGLMAIKSQLGSRLKKSSKIREIVILLEGGLRLFVNFPQNGIMVFFASFGFLIACGCRLFIAFNALGIDVNFTSVMLVQAMVGLSLVFSITPGNLGVKEGIIGLCGMLLGVNFDQAVLASLLDRMAAMTMVFTLGLLYSRVLLQKLTK